MKTTLTTLKLLVAVIMTALCCFSANAANPDYSGSLNGATLIYSNSFNGGQVDITGTAPTFINPVLGGTNTATFQVVTNNAAVGYWGWQDGTLGTNMDSVILPFIPTNGYIYTLSAGLTFKVAPVASGWGGLGFGTNFLTSNSRILSDVRLGSVAMGGNPWALLNFAANGGGALFYAPNNHNVAGIPNLMTVLNNTYPIKLILDTTGTNWFSALYVNGTYVGGYAYAGTGGSTNIRCIGYTQTTTTPNSFQWGPLTLSASPMVITTQPISASVGGGSAFTNTVVVSAVAPAYQWYTNNVPILNATNASLILNPVTDANACTNYYVVITNSLGGSVTSAPVSLTVYDAPVFSATYPVTYTNLTTFYGATNVSGTNYLGSSPTFSVSVIGTEPLNYQWLTNGAPVVGATSTNFTFTNCPLNGPTNFTCVVSNSFGLITNTWLASYLPSPMATFPQTVMADSPIGFWRLNEGPDDGSGNDGVIAMDYAGANNGIYTNVTLAQAGFTNTDPTDASVLFNYPNSHSDVFGISGIDFSNSANAEFSVQAWVNGSVSQPNGACIIAKGYNGGEQFALDINGNKFRFLVRNKVGTLGTVSSVTAPTGPDGSNWHLLVGVCDEASGKIALYVDGLSVGSATITAGSGVFPSSTPISIGARGATANDIDAAQFSGELSDVAIYNYPLTPKQVASLWPGVLPLSFIPPLPPTNYAYQAGTTNGTILIPATVFSFTAPIGYYWTNVTAGGIVASGETNVGGNLICDLTIPNASPSLDGNVLELVATNGAGSTTNWFVSLTNVPPPVTLSYSNAILYSNSFIGGTWSMDGQAATAANILVGGTNTAWHVVTNNPPAGDAAYANGTLGNQRNSVILPFTPRSGYIYTLSASLTFQVTPPAGGWGGLGFSTQFPTNYVVDARIMNNWTLLNMFANGGGAQLFCTTNGNNNPTFIGQVPNLMTALNTPYNIQLVLDTTSNKWSMALYVAGTFVTNYIYTAGNPALASFGYTQTGTTAGAFKWNYIAMTQVAPGGVPPYLLDPLPPTSSILLTNGTVAINASAFGSGPLGYYWTNNATIVASGSTNNMAPLPANLSVSSASLSAGQLLLVVTNAYGTNITIIPLLSSVIVPTNSAGITGFSLVGADVLINGTNGQGGGTYYLLGSTNIATPLSQWLPVATNVVNTNGDNVNGFTFRGTNVVNINNPGQFYILSSTNNLP